MVDGAKDVKEGGDAGSDDSCDGSDLEGLDQVHKLKALAELLKLPAGVKRRVNALKQLLHKSVDIEVEFYKEIFEVELKFESKYAELWDKRKEIILGNTEPTDEECKWTFDDEEIQLASTLSPLAIEEVKDDVKGIPQFWLKALLHNSVTEAMITETDNAILASLEDVRCRLVSGEESGFYLDFFFSPNEYFTNSVITKQYIFNHKPPEESPLDYDGPEIIQCRGCSISWKQGKNPTVKIVKKTKKHKQSNTVKTVPKKVKQDSFFNFFDPPLESLNDSTVDEATVELLHEDFKIGHFMRESLIPRAILFFTGEAYDSDMEDEDESDDDDDDDFDDEDIEGDDDVNDSDDDVPFKKFSNDAKKRAPTKKKGGKEAEECKQQ